MQFNMVKAIQSFRCMEELCNVIGGEMVRTNLLPFLTLEMQDGNLQAARHHYEQSLKLRNKLYHYGEEGMKSSEKV